MKYVNLIILLIAALCSLVFASPLEKRQTSAKVVPTSSTKQIPTSVAKEPPLTSAKVTPTLPVKAPPTSTSKLPPDEYTATFTVSAAKTRPATSVKTTYPAKDGTSIVLPTKTITGSAKSVPSTVETSTSKTTPAKTTPVTTAKTAPVKSTPIVSSKTAPVSSS